MKRRYIERQTAYGKIRKPIGHCFFCDHHKGSHCQLTTKFIKEPDKLPEDCPLPEEP